MKRIFLIYFILNLLNVKSQNFDSLKIVANKLPGDSDRVNLFYTEGFTNRATNAQYSYDCAKQAESEAQKTSLPFYIAKAGNLLGVLFYRKGDLATAISYHKKALNLRMLINDKKGIAISQTNLGNIYSDLKQFKRAEEAYLIALEINNELNLPKQIDNCLLNLGVLSTDLKVINVAEGYFNKALANAKKRFDYEVQSTCFNNLAVINIIKEDYDAAIANCRNSIKIKNLMDNEMDMADSYVTIATAYIKKKESENALTNLKIADSIIVKFNYLAAKILALKAYSEYYELEKNYEAALNSSKKATQLNDSIETVNKEITLENNFIETKIITEANPVAEKHFPYSFFILLLLVAVSISVFIFRYKR